MTHARFGLRHDLRMFERVHNEIYHLTHHNTGAMNLIAAKKQRCALCTCVTKHACLHFLAQPRETIRVELELVECYPTICRFQPSGNTPPKYLQLLNCERCPYLVTTVSQVEMTACLHVLRNFQGGQRRHYRKHKSAHTSRGQLFHSLKS